MRCPQGALLAARLDADAEQQRAAPAAPGSMQPGALSQHGPTFRMQLPDPPAPALPHGGAGGLALRRRRAAPLLPASQLASARDGSAGEPLGRAAPAAGARDGGAACWRAPAAAGDAGEPILLSDSSDEDGGAAARGGGGDPCPARAGSGGAADQGSQAAGGGGAGRGLDPADRLSARQTEELAEAALARRRTGCGAAGLQPGYSSGSGGLPRAAAPPPPPSAGAAPPPRAGTHGHASGAARPPLPPQPPAPRPGGSLPEVMNTREPGSAGGQAQTSQQAQPMLATACAGVGVAARSQASAEAVLGSQGSGGMGGEHSGLVRGCRECALSQAFMLS
jgi:hypothetical protein